MRHVFTRIWALGHKHNFNYGASVEEIEECENAMGVQLPTYISKYACLLQLQERVFHTFTQECQLLNR